MTVMVNIIKEDSQRFYQTTVPRMVSLAIFLAAVTLDHLT